MKCIVEAKRSGRWWSCHCREVPDAISQTRKLNEIDELMCEVIGAVAHVDPKTVEIEVVVVLPEEVSNDLHEAERLRAISKDTNHKAAVSSRSAVRRLREIGLTLEDISQVIGVSRGRVSQLINS